MSVVPGCRSHHDDTAEIQNRIKTPDDRRWTRCPRLLLTGRSADTLNASVLQLLMQSYFSWKLVKVSNASPAGFFFFLVCLFVTPWPHKVTSPCDKPTSDQTNSEQTKHSWNKPQLLPAKIFFPSKPRNIFSLVQTSIRLYFKSTIYFLNTLQNFGSRSWE